MITRRSYPGAGGRESLAWAANMGRSVRPVRVCRTWSNRALGAQRPRAALQAGQGDQPSDACSLSAAWSCIQ